MADKKKKTGIETQERPGCFILCTGKGGLIPAVINGRIIIEDEAIDHYYETPSISECSTHHRKQMSTPRNFSTGKTGIITGNKIEGFGSSFC